MILNTSLEFASRSRPADRREPAASSGHICVFLAPQAGGDFTSLASDRRAVDWPMIADTWLRPIIGYKSSYRL
jgi:hypothetical protein